MEKRAYERIPAALEVKFFCSNTSYSGTIVNLSENGMFINARMSFPFDTMFEILIPLKEEIMKIPVKVARIVKTDDYYDGVGVELLDPPQNYLEFVNTLKSAFKPC